jgi:N-acetylglutamate synthase-like GNAT family acetyltransferase
MKSVTIYPMSDYRSDVPKIASWFYEEWRSLYGDETLESVRKRIDGWCVQDKLPTALVAVHEGVVIGTVALKERELEQCAYTPWLAGLYVAQEYRGLGVGRLLTKAAESKAAALGIEKLYLYTPESQPYYEILGWSLVEHRNVSEKSVAVMSKAIMPDSKRQTHAFGTDKPAR